MEDLSNVRTEPSHPPRSETAELALGCWAFGDSYWSRRGQPARENQEDRKSPEGAGEREFFAYRKILQEAFSRGIRHFDTARGYGNGSSEQVTGQQLRKKRQDVCIATKTFFRPAGTVRKGIEKSLKRLQTDYIDIYYFHWPKPGRDLRPHMEELEKARRDGLIRRIGVSNFQPAQIEPLLEVGRVDYCQFGYSLLWRLPETELVPFCMKRKISMITYSSLAQGLLAHPPEWADSLSQEDPRRRLVLMRSGTWDKVREVIRALHAEAAHLEIPPAVLALAWNLSRPWARYVLFGARSLSQVRECTEAAELRLPEDPAGRIDALSSGLVKLFGEEDNIFGHHP